MLSHPLVPTTLRYTTRLWPFRSKSYTIIRFITRGTLCITPPTAYHPSDELFLTENITRYQVLRTSYHGYHTSSYDVPWYLVVVYSVRITLRHTWYQVLSISGIQWSSTQNWHLLVMGCCSRLYHARRLYHIPRTTIKRVRSPLCSAVRQNVERSRCTHLHG